MNFKHPFFRNPGYRLGVMGDVSGSNVFGHTGEGPGYCASAYQFDYAGCSTTIAVFPTVKVLVTRIAYCLHLPETSQVVNRI